MQKMVNEFKKDKFNDWNVTLAKCLEKSRQEWRKILENQEETDLVFSLILAAEVVNVVLMKTLYQNLYNSLGFKSSSWVQSDQTE